MSVVDLAIASAVAGAALLGARRGFVVSACAWAGLTGGVWAGAIAGRGVASLLERGDARLAVAVALPLLGAAVGDALGWWLGARIRGRLGAGRRADAAAGAVATAGVALILTWVVGVNLAVAPPPALASAIRGSVILATIDRALPQAPPAVVDLRALLRDDASPLLFQGLPPGELDGTATPDPDDVAAAIAAATSSVVRVTAFGCGGRSVGTGFVIAQDRVLTAAHVVAGMGPISVLEIDGRETDATVIAFDPRLDLAMLRVAIGASPLSIDPDEVAEGTTGAVLGFPTGDTVASDGAVLVRSIVAEGRDLSGRLAVERRLAILRADARPGWSGGPFVLADGAVAGLVVAADAAVGATYVTPADAIVAWIVALDDSDMPVGTGTCLRG